MEAPITIYLLFCVFALLICIFCFIFFKNRPIFMHLYIDISFKIWKSKHFQLPYYKDGTVSLSQSHAILRYIGRKYNLSKNILNLFSYHIFTKECVAKFHSLCMRIAFSLFNMKERFHFDKIWSFYIKFQIRLVVKIYSMVIIWACIPKRA